MMMSSLPAHHLHCMSWAFNMSRRALVEHYGKDIWVRDELGQNVNYDELLEALAGAHHSANRQVHRSRSGGNESNDGGRIIIV